MHIYLFGEECTHNEVLVSPERVVDLDLDDVFHSPLAFFASLFLISVPNKYLKQLEDNLFSPFF